MGIALLGFAAAAAANVWWDRFAGILLALAGFLCSAVALGLLYDTRRPLRYKAVPLSLGYLALLALYGVGSPAARDVAATLIGDDTEATVARTWLEHGRKSGTHYHCSLRRLDGTPVPRELATDCKGRSTGDTLRIVVDPAGRLAPIAGPKSDLDTKGELLITSLAILTLLLTTALGAPPKPRRTPAGPSGDGKSKGVPGTN
jgi:hypothetical protein